MMRSETYSASEACECVGGANHDRLACGMRIVGP
jgi:hypothetical protein